MFLSKKDFKVRITGRAGLIYQEGKKSMNVDSEMLSGPTFDIVIYKDSIKGWEPPFSSDPVDDNEKRRIIENIKSDLEKSGYKVDFA